MVNAINTMEKDTNPVISVKDTTPDGNFSKKFMMDRFANIGLIFSKKIDINKKAMVIIADIT